jgi:hypothetical protein
MSLDAVSGLSGSSFAPLNRAPAVTQVAAPTQGSPVTSGASQATASAIDPTKPSEPLLLVPTQPLSPTVLAELIGRHLSLT